MVKRTSKKAKASRKTRLVGTCKATRNGNGNTRLLSLARAIADPCGAPPAPGFYGNGDGYVVRHKKVYTAAGGSSKHGYFLIDPSFTSQAYSAGTARRSSWFSFGTSDPNWSPTNNVADPYGNDDDPTNPMVTARTEESPHDVFLYNNAHKYRVVSCCMKVSYIGSTSSAGGLIATIQNLDPDALFTPDSTDADTTGSSVNQIISRSPNVFRMGVDPVELKWRPSPTSDMHREPYHSVVTTGVRASTRSTPYGYVRSIDNLGTVTNQLVTTTAGRPALFGVAWTGLPGSNADIRIEVTVNTEFVPKPDVGMPAPPRAMLSTSSTWKDAIAYLDRNLPSWDTVVKASQAAIAVKRALGGQGINPLRITNEL